MWDSRGPRSFHSGSCLLEFAWRIRAITGEDLRFKTKDVSSFSKRFRAGDGR